MKLVDYCLQNRMVTLVLIIMIVIGGWLSYESLGRLEDPEFTIKEAVIFTPYPGATAEEVEQEITEPLETAVQQLKQLEEVRSISRAGLSIIFAEIQDSYDKETLPQVWDELRRKINDAAAGLPPGASAPIINDDFGDVYGIFLAITGDGYSQRELQKVTEDFRRELLLCEDVGRIDFWGFQQEAVYIEFDRAKLARLGLPPASIFNTISQQNSVTDTGSVRVGSEYVKLRVTGDYLSIEDMGDQLIQGGSEGGLIRLKDVATISKDYVDPGRELLSQNGSSAVGIGISTVSGGNVVNMGDAVKVRLGELESRLPVGMTIHTISYQADTVRTAVNGFVLNLFEAVAIVVLLLVIFMGVREGIIIGAVLLVTILATFICMKVLGVNLQRISLGALIIALGMLVDNAIVVAEGYIIKIRQGFDTITAAKQTVKETQWPLLGATVIAILAFAAISLSKDVTGEFLGSLFKVIGLALGLSWILALTVVPYLCVTFIPAKGSGSPTQDLYNNFFFRGYRSFLKRCIRLRWITILVVICMLGGAIYGFGFVKQNFFPGSTRPQFIVDLTYPEGTHIDYTNAKLVEIGGYFSGMEGVTDVTTFTGGGALRFILTYTPEMPNSAYGQLLVTVDDYSKIDTLIPQVRSYLDTHHPNAVTKVEKFKLGPGGKAVEARFSGPDTAVLRSLSEKAIGVMRAHQNTSTISSDWGEKVKVVTVNMAGTRSRETGVFRPEIATSIAGNFSGNVAGLYREGEDLLPIIVRPPANQREGINNLENIMVWSSSAGYVPFEQITNGVTTSWENPVIRRLNRQRTITISCIQLEGTAMALFNELRSDIENISLPQGYSLEWGGEHESANDANRKLMAKVPLAFSIMFLISVMLFNSLRHPIIIFLGLPMALIGVAAGLLIFDKPFGFMALLGFLSLSGMLMKNEIVLLDQINIELAKGKAPLLAVIDSAVSRVRPVALAAFTTVLGMIPLLWDAFFEAMAVTIMGGLTFATILTLVVVPVLYCTFWRITDKTPAATTEATEAERELELSRPIAKQVAG